MRKAKKEYWQNFFEDIKKSSNLAQIWLKVNNWYWIALKYIKPKFNSITLVFILPNNEIVVIVKDKKALVRLHNFLPLLIFYRTKYKPEKRTADTLFTNNHIG